MFVAGQVDLVQWRVVGLVVECCLHLCVCACVCVFVYVFVSTITQIYRREHLQQQYCSLYLGPPGKNHHHYHHFHLASLDWRGDGPLEEAHTPLQSLLCGHCTA